MRMQTLIFIFRLTEKKHRFCAFFMCFTQPKQQQQFKKYYCFQDFLFYTKPELNKYYCCLAYKSIEADAK